MRKEDFLTELEAIAPKELALPFDNVGLLVGTTRGEINRVLVALDCTDAVAREAVEFGADMVLNAPSAFLYADKADTSRRPVDKGGIYADTERHRPLCHAYKS